VAEVVVPVVLRRHERGVQVGALGVDDVVVAGGVDAGRVMAVYVLVLVHGIERRVWVVIHSRRVVVLRRRRVGGGAGDGGLGLVARHGCVVPCFAFPSVETAVEALCCRYAMIFSVNLERRGVFQPRRRDV